MKERQEYLVESVVGILQKQGYCKQKSDACSMPWGDAVYSHNNGNILFVEYKMAHLYRAEEFRGLVGDAILRFERSGCSAPGRRLLLAFLLSRKSRRAEQDLRDYASRFSPDLQWLVLAEDGSGRIHIDEQDNEIESAAMLSDRERIHAEPNRAGLFSPKSQWLWKLLLMPGMDRSHWGGPSQKPGSINELAELSHVSQPSVSSFISRAEAAGFVRRVSSGFVVERHQELLEDWVYAIKHSRREEQSLQFIYPAESEEQWLKKVRSLCQPAGRQVSVPPLVIGSHLACHLMGLGRSNVRRPWLYVKGNRSEIMAALDLAEAGSESAPLSMVVPQSPESVFCGLVRIDGIPVCDILQCYLDVRLSHARGIEQAEVIMNQILRPHFEGRK